MGRRVLMELRYAAEVNRVDGGRWDSLILSAVDSLERALAAEGVLSDAEAAKAEALLLPMGEAAKRYTVLCVGHAHIDMNWMWRYDETVSITLDTFRTVLQLLREYPEFRFSQSQASVYEIVEEYSPELLEEIRRYVSEGRWELSAATWVEADRNMPSGESMARQLLYTRRYLTRLMGASADDFRLDFEPDTFGHNASVPEILSKGGVRYYYHCRGDENEALYRWRSPSGAELLCYREPYWYLGPIEAEFALGAPAFCSRFGLDTHMRVYGVGDHGGGPTRRDIERLLDMAEWPVFPVMRFGTYKEFFEKAEKAVGLTVTEGELNSVFTGCYTSQARITQSNRFGEAKLGEAERLAALAALETGRKYPKQAFEKAWRKVLFNQFHDILPGSGVIDTREYAMGIFSQAVAAADTQKAEAMRALGKLADTSAYQNDEGMADSVSEGAGVGYGVGYGMAGGTFPMGHGIGQPFRVAGTERGRGINRVFHLFNPSAVAREEVVELTVFDWPGEYRRLVIRSADGSPLPHQLIDKTPQEFWQHRFVRLLIKAALPAGGRCTCVLTEDTDSEPSPAPMADQPRVEKPYAYSLENEYIVARFCAETGALLSLTDKASGGELLRSPSGFFRIIDEQPAENTAGTSWTIGRYRSVLNLTDDVVIRQTLTGPLKNAITITARGRDSTVTYTVSLSAGSRWLELDCDIDWREVGVPMERTPQLNFTLPIAGRRDFFVQDIPGGLLSRGSVSQDVACQSFAAAAVGGGMLMLMSDSKYGFRCESTQEGSVMSLSCLRSSTDPDPYPEFGRHHFRIGIGLSPDSGEALLNTSFAFCNAPGVVSDLPRKGSRPMAESLLEVSGAFLQAVKLAEDSDHLILRLVETEGRDGSASVTFPAEVLEAAVADTHESPIANPPELRTTGRTLNVPLRAHSTLCLRVGLAGRLGDAT